MPRSQDKDPDYLLAEDEFPELNKQFYHATPHDYFAQRLQSLLLLAGRGDDIDHLVREGLTFGRLTVAPQPDQPSVEDEQQKQREARERFIIIESEVLLHHASESLLRLFLAHEPKILPDGTLKLPECPWLEIARLRDFREFKTRVSARFVEPGDELIRRMQVSTVFYGVARKALHPVPPQEEWDAGLLNIGRFLSHYARHLLGSANLYNAAKHGLAVMPGDATVQLDDGALLKADGPSILYLETEADSEGRVRWNQTTAWIDLDRTITFVHLACQFIEAIWGVARVRYTGLTEGMLVRPFTNPRYESLIDTRPIQVSTMSIQLGYCVAAESENGNPL